MGFCVFINKENNNILCRRRRGRGERAAVCVDQRTEGNGTETTRATAKSTEREPTEQY